MSNNAFLVQTKYSTDNDEIDNTSKRHTISLDNATWLRMKSHGSFGMTWDDLLNVMLDELERKELPEGEHSF